MDVYCHFHLKYLTVIWLLVFLLNNQFYMTNYCLQWNVIINHNKSFMFTLSVQIIPHLVVIRCTNTLFDFCTWILIYYLHSQDHNWELHLISRTTSLIIRTEDIFYKTSLIIQTKDVFYKTSQKIRNKIYLNTKTIY